MRSAVLIALLLLTMPVTVLAGDSSAQANEGICDELIGATPGLYGLCMAQNQADECVADYQLEDPFQNCSPPSARIIEKYNERRQPSDPLMPGVAMADCPCWMPSELDVLRYPSPGDQYAKCAFHEDASHFDIYGPELEPYGVAYHSLANSRYTSWLDKYSCSYFYAECELTDFGVRCNPNIHRTLEITEYQFLSCAVQVAEAGLERGFDCFE